jgi:putative ABC transport system ATP-binding protein
MIRLENLTKIYESNSGQIVALENINLEINEGEVVVLKGASGSGKSTILSLLANMTKPTSGEVIVKDMRVSKMSDDFSSAYRLSNIGFIFQKYNLIPNLTVSHNIMLPLIPQNLKEEFIQTRLEYLLDFFKIKGKRDIEVNKLSGGEQQRVAIARALVNNPDIILADEPTANLDEKLSYEFLQMLEELKKLHKTIIIATHDPIFFENVLVDKIVAVRNGKIEKVMRKCF